MMFRIHLATLPNCTSCSSLPSPAPIPLHTQLKHACTSRSTKGWQNSTWLRENRYQRYLCSERQDTWVAAVERRKQKYTDMFTFAHTQRDKHILCSHACQNKRKKKHEKQKSHFYILSFSTPYIRHSAAILSPTEAEACQLSFLPQSFCNSTFQNIN